MRLFLDLDGTLMDPGEGITRCFAHALARMGRAAPPAAELRGWIGPPLREAFVALLGTDRREPVEQAVSFYRERFATEGLYENALYPGVTEALARLRAARWRLLLVTSKPRVYATRIADHFGLSERLDGIFGSELSGLRQDKRELIHHVLAEDGPDTEATWMVGDRRHDVEGARANGLPALGMLWGYGSEAELHQAGAVRLFRSMEELVGWALGPPGPGAGRAGC